MAGTGEPGYPDGAVVLLRFSGARGGVPYYVGGALHTIPARRTAAPLN